METDSRLRRDVEVKNGVITLASHVDRYAALELRSTATP